MHKTANTESITVSAFLDNFIKSSENFSSFYHMRVTLSRALRANYRACADICHTKPHAFDAFRYIQILLGNSVLHAHIDERGNTRGSDNGGVKAPTDIDMPAASNKYKM